MKNVMRDWLSQRQLGFPELSHLNLETISQSDKQLLTSF
jgi:hypothetical protein